MSINSPGDNGGSEFRHPHLRELDTLLMSLYPAKRAAFLQSAYVNAMKGNYERDFIVQLAGLLKKWSTEKHSFAGEAEKLLAKNGGEIRETMDSTSALIESTINQADKDKQI